MHVESKLSELLISLLPKYGRLKLEGIAVFQFEQTDAFLNEVDNILHPPSKRLCAYAAQAGVLNFIEAVRKEGLATDYELSELKVYISLKAFELSTSQLIDIDGVGQVSWMEGVIELHPTKSNYSAVGPHLPRLNLDEPTEVVAQQIDPQVYVTADEGTKQRSTSLGQNISQSEKGFVKTYLSPVLLFITGALLIVFVFKYCANHRTTTNTSNLPIIRSTDDVDPLEGIKEQPIFTNPILTKYKDVLTQEIINSGCKIAVGSYSDEHNAQKMAQNVSEKGFQSSLIIYEDAHRVIVTFDCAQHDLMEYLANVKREVTPEAWFYEPMMDKE